MHLLIDFENIWQQVKNLIWNVSWYFEEKNYNNISGKKVGRDEILFLFPWVEMVRKL